MKQQLSIALRGQRRGSEVPWAPPEVGDVHGTPVPRREGRAQVFSTWQTLPVGARALSLVLEAPARRDAEAGRWRWTFSYELPGDRLLILRSVMLLPEVQYALQSSTPVYRLAPPGALDLLLLRSRSAIPYIGGTDQNSAPMITQGTPWQTYVLFKPRELLGLVVRTTGPLRVTEGEPMRALIEGDLLSVRGLPTDMEVGHDAPMVRVQPGEPPEPPR